MAACLAAQLISSIVLNRILAALITEDRGVMTAITAIYAVAIDGAFHWELLLAMPWMPALSCAFDVMLIAFEGGRSGCPTI